MMEIKRDGVKLSGGSAGANLRNFASIATSVLVLCLQSIVVCRAILYLKTLFLKLEMLGHFSIAIALDRVSFYLHAGNIPPELGKLHALATLMLSDNNLDGELLCSTSPN